MTFLIYILAFAVLLGVLVTIHEFGHFIFARMFKVHVQRFSIGMGPVFYKRYDKNFLRCQDYELWLAMSQKIRLHYIKKPLGFYDNYNQKSITNNNQIKRMKNLILVLFRYHNYVTLSEFLLTLLKHLTAFLIKIIRN